VDHQIVNPELSRRPAKKPGRTLSLFALLTHCAPFVVPTLVIPAFAQTPLPLSTAAQLAAERAPMVNTGTLLAFAWHESRLHPFAVHDNVTGQSIFPASAEDAAILARARLALGHSLDLGIMQVNSANFARTGLTVTTAFDAGESMRAGALILTAAYQHCLRGDASPPGDVQQAALRCAASIYNTGREQMGILNGYQGEVWRAAALVVPAIRFGAASALPSSPAAPEDVVAPEPHRPPPALEDALHAAPPVPDASEGLNDALHHASRKEAP
jgi:type IV secretion system protein VirB1